MTSEAKRYAEIQRETIKILRREADRYVKVGNVILGGCGRAKETSHGPPVVPESPKKKLPPKLIDVWRERQAV